MWAVACACLLRVAGANGLHQDAGRRAPSSVRGRGAAAPRRTPPCRATRAVAPRPRGLACGGPMPGDGTAGGRQPKDGRWRLG